MDFFLCLKRIVESKSTAFSRNLPEMNENPSGQESRTGQQLTVSSRTNDLPK